MNQVILDELLDNPVQSRNISVPRYGQCVYCAKQMYQACAKTYPEWFTKQNRAHKNRRLKVQRFIERRTPFQLCHFFHEHLSKNPVAICMRHLREEADRLDELHEVCRRTPIPGKMPEHWAHRAFNILVEVCEAHEADREAFIHHQCYDPGECREYRFGGSLGFGGKFWNNNDKWYVNCYPEDATPERESAIKEANDRLAEIHTEYKGEESSTPTDQRNTT